MIRRIPLLFISVLAVLTCAYDGTSSSSGGGAGGTALSGNSTGAPPYYEGGSGPVQVCDMYGGEHVTKDVNGFEVTIQIPVECLEQEPVGEDPWDAEFEDEFEPEYHLVPVQEY